MVGKGFVRITVLELSFLVSPLLSVPFGADLRNCMGGVTLQLQC